MTAPRIRVLPDDLVSRIAAGEVIERPASVLKELIENSFDAGATRLEVAIEGAGRALLRVSDDGCGMSLEDARLCLLRHATSKISRLEDLEGVATYGFRGEAIPSIASVSRFRLHTRRREDDTGWEIVCEGGRTVSERPLAREPGTTIEVRDLFFNTPARFKFLKSDATERAHCLRVVEEAAFASPAADLALRAEAGKPVTFSSVRGADGAAADAFLERVARAWGGRWSDVLRPVRAAQPHFALRGWISRPERSQASPRHQVLFINRRPVSNRRVTRAAYDAFVGRLPSGRHPAWILFLEVNPQAVDVNVHPSKREVKLTFENEIFQFVRGALTEALGAPSPGSDSPSWTAPSLGGGAFSRPPEPRPVPRDIQVALDLYAPAAASAWAASEPRPAGRTEAAVAAEAPLRAVGQAHRLFVVAESASGVVLVDQHAAAERVLYEKILREARSAAPAVQMLLAPHAWEVALSLRSAVAAALPDLNALGYAVEPFGGETFLVKGVPASLGDAFDLGNLLDGLSDVLAESADRRGGHERDFHHKLAAQTACRGSIRAGDALDLRSCQALLDAWSRCESPATCPHGRPVLAEFPVDDLKRKFRRPL